MLCDETCPSRSIALRTERRWYGVSHSPNQRWIHVNAPLLDPWSAFTTRRAGLRWGSQQPERSRRKWPTSSKATQVDGEANDDDDDQMEEDENWQLRCCQCVCVTVYVPISDSYPLFIPFKLEFLLLTLCSLIPTLREATSLPTLLVLCRKHELNIITLCLKSDEIRPIVG